MLASFVFLTPWAALVAIVVVVPLAALAAALWRERQARRLLRLDDPPRGRLPRAAVAVVSAAALLGIAAAQPAIRSTTELPVRTDAETIYVFDTSRSMLAAATRRSPTRLERARTAAIRLRRELAGVPSGVATLTDRVLPDLLPDGRVDVFEQTVGGAVRVDNPPPQTEAPIATSLGALAALGTQNFFSPSARHRLLVVFTDGESRAYDLQATARALRRAPGAKTLFVHVWSPGEAVFGPDGRPENGYHADASSRAALTALAEATGGTVVGEGSIGRAGRLARTALGAGPSRQEGLTERTRTLAPWVALASLLPLGLALAFGGARRRSLAAQRADGRGPERAASEGHASFVATH
jgi:hypothetical protein